MTQVLYLKYRPQKFADLDLVEARDFFGKLLESGQIPHAFLLTGPRGIGKTSAARIFAKAVNCLSNQEDGKWKEKLTEPCGKCDACTAINNGSAMDVIEIDAASNRGIDDVRELKEKVKLLPVSLLNKVFIIDECHMLTTEASNALLKTLEEPPGRTFFVLCTTEFHKVLPTIVSRCTRLNFRQADIKEITGRLAKVATGEGIEISGKGLEMVANAGKGSFRDAVKILEQASSGGKKISDHEVATLVGQEVEGDPGKLLDTLVCDDLKGALVEVDRMVVGAVSLRVVIERALERIRGAMINKAGIEISNGQGEGGGNLTKLDMVELTRLARAFEKAGRELKEAIILSLPLELLAVEWCGGKSKKTTEGDKIEIEKEIEIETREKTAELPEEIASSPLKPVVAVADVVLKWPEVLRIVKPKNHSIEALLRSTRPVEISGGSLEIEVFYKFHKERLETDKCRRVIEESLAEVFGAPLLLRLKLGKGPEKKIRENLDTAENISGKEVGEDILNAAEQIFGVEAV